jgi:hypothetical protein
MAEKTENMTAKAEPADQSNPSSDRASIHEVVPEGVDIALGWFEEMRTVPQDELEAESKAVRRRCDLILMPIICITYALQFLDNAVLGYAYAYGILGDTVSAAAIHTREKATFGVSRLTRLLQQGMTGGDYNWLASIYYFGYLFVSDSSTQILGFD